MSQSTQNRSRKDVADVLIVEDNMVLSYTMGLKLKQKGYSVTKTGNGKEGLALAIEQNPALLILDIMLPEMDGFGILRELRKRESTKDMKVLILTSKGQEKDVKTGFDLQADEYMTKPFSVEELLMRVVRLIG
ncbi:response regulator transcription factor [Fodinibius sp. AD559]|uniref:response regulator transcription factor n=1 Tax=Fodinibius sp. AD559 TaxID=3424179 RepID=UPI004046D46C